MKREFTAGTVNYLETHSFNQRLYYWHLGKKERKHYFEKKNLETKPSDLNVTCSALISPENKHSKS